jgi:hypothetical protein
VAGLFQAVAQRAQAAADPLLGAHRIAGRLGSDERFKRCQDGWRFFSRRAASGDLVLRNVPEPWPFPPHLRVVPELVAAVDLAEGPAICASSDVSASSSSAPAWTRPGSDARDAGGWFGRLSLQRPWPDQAHACS